MWKSKTKSKKSKKAFVEQMVQVADHLDEIGLREEATAVDNILQKEAQWQWIKEKGQQLKDWFQTERELNPQMRQQLTKLRQNHWNLIKQLNAAYTLLSSVWKNMTKPEYVRDLTNAIRNIQTSLQYAAKSADEAGNAARQMVQQQQAQPGAPTATPGAQSEVQPEATSPDLEKTQVIEPEVQQQLADYSNATPEEQQKIREQLANANPDEQQQIKEQLEKTQVIDPKEVKDLLDYLDATPEEQQRIKEQLSKGGSLEVAERLLKLADKLEHKGQKQLANRIDTLIKRSQWQTIKDKWQQSIDWVSKINPKYKQLAEVHWRLMNRLKAAHDALQAARQNITDINMYPQVFLTHVQTFQDDLKNIQADLENLGQSTGAAQSQEPQATTSEEEEAQPAAPQATPQATPPAASAPAPATPAAPTEEADIQKALAELTPESRTMVIQLIQQLLRGQQPSRTQ